MTVNSITSEQCCGCAACMEKCPVHAIGMMDDLNGNRRTIVSENLCIQCGLCAKVCPHFYEAECSSFEKQAYVGFANCKSLIKKSSSGGIFAILAQHVICQGGCVYGAAMVYEGETLVCKHIRIDSLQSLSLLQGSKYVQSRTDGIYSMVSKDLSEGKLVLFSGTSCQVASLKRFVGDKDLLFTVDLVCHGVPKDRVFRDYVTYLEKKHQCRIIDMSFRCKEKKFYGKEEMFILSFQCKKSACQVEKKVVHNRKSAYYNLFLSKAGYRDSCYHCKYATLQKPADLTLGDFLPRKNEIEQYGFSSSEHYSSIIVHNEKGEALIESVKNELVIHHLSMDEMLKHHHNLKTPSVPTLFGKKMYKVYLEKGFVGLQKKVDIKYMKFLIKARLNNCLKHVRVFIKQ